jgi:hypothetical protein
MGWAAAALVVAACAICARPSPASASLLSKGCGVVGNLNGAAGKACSFLGSLGGSGGGASAASTALGLAAIGTWVVTGAKFTLAETTKVLGETATPQLTTSWFSSAYWRIAGIAALLTLPFLFAAAIQALMRSDIALLGHAVLGYLPLAMLGVALAAPVTMLLLATSDQLCGVITSAAGGASPHAGPSHVLLARLTVGLASVTAPFLVFLIAVMTTGAALVLWIELAVREAAVYVVVLMLPLAFAAIVWPARRVWAIRALELLVALILSKIAIVAVLELGGAALDQLGRHGFSGVMASLAGTVLVLLAALSPWAVLRLVPFSELASGAAGSLRPALSGGVSAAHQMGETAGAQLGGAAERVASRMRDQSVPLQSPDDTSDGGAQAESRRLSEQPAQHPLAADQTAPDSVVQPSGAPPAFREWREDEAQGHVEDEDEGDLAGNGASRSAAWPVLREDRKDGVLILGSDENWPNPRPWGEYPAEGSGPTGPVEDANPLPPPQNPDRGPL